MWWILGALVFIAVWLLGAALFNIHPTMGEGLLVVAACVLSDAVRQIR